MRDAPFLLALTAGMVGAINPCGFALLPAYIGFFVSGENADATAERRMIRAITSAIAVTLGFVTVFVVFGTALSSATMRIQAQLPWVTLSVGALLVVAGLLTVAGRKVPMPRVALRASHGRGFVAMSSYGAVYALASLSCTIGPFLAISAAAFGGSFIGGIAAYAVYGLGMGVIILAVACCAALARPRPVDVLRRLTRHAVRVGGGLMVLSGGYAIWYARWELAVYHGDLRTNAVVQFGERWRLAAVTWIDRVGATELAVIIVAATAFTLVVIQLRTVAGTDPSVNEIPDEHRA